MTTLHIPTRKLWNGVEIPIIGVGTYELGPVKELLSDGLDMGLYHIDTAAFYENEKEIGETLRAKGLPRGSYFVTSKLWVDSQGYEKAIQAFNQTLARLGLDYVDLYLIHWPGASGVAKGSIENERLRLESWRALETLYEEGKCKAIGVSNFTIPHLENLLANCKVKPMVNQVEFHPKLFQKDLVGFCEKNGIVVEAYSPFAKGALLTNAVVKKVAQLHGKSAAQIICKWCLQHNTVVLPKCSTTARLQENFSVFDFELTTEDMQTLDGLNDNWHCTWDPTNIR